MRYTINFVVILLFSLPRPDCSQKFRFRHDVYELHALYENNCNKFELADFKPISPNILISRFVDPRFTLQVKPPRVKKDKKL